MFVVFDTTETYDDLSLSGPKFSLLRSYVFRHPAKLVVSQLVVEETINHYRERLENKLREAHRSLSDLKYLVPYFPELPDFNVDVETAAADFRARLEAAIKGMDGKQVGFEKVKTSDLVERALRRRKPFDSDGKKGFRDAILWETVLHEIVECEGDGVQVALITKNSKDFCKEGILAETLGRECESVGASADCVQVYDGLQAFIDSVVKPSLDKLDQIQEQIQEGGYKSFDPSEFYHDFYDLIEHEVRDHVRRWDFERVKRRVLGDYHSFDLHSLEDTVFEYKAVDVWNIDDKQMAAGIDFTINGEVKCMMERDEWHGSGDEWFSEPYDEEVVGVASLKIAMTIILSKDDGDVDNWEVNDIEVDLGDAWPTHYDD